MRHAITINRDSITVPKSTGMKYQSLAPKADLTIIEGRFEKVVKEINTARKGKIRQQAIR